MSLVNRLGHGLDAHRFFSQKDSSYGRWRAERGKSCPRKGVCAEEPKHGGGKGLWGMRGLKLPKKHRAKTLSPLKSLSLHAFKVDQIWVRDMGVSSENIWLQFYLETLWWTCNMHGHWIWLTMGQGHERGALGEFGYHFL